MKRLVVVLGGLLALPAFAEVAPYYYTDALEYGDAEYAMDGDILDEEVVAEEDTDIKKPVVPVKASPRTITTRNGSRANVGTTTVNPRRTSAANSRVVASRTTTSRAPVTTSRTVVSRTTATRTPVAASRTAATRGSVSRAATNNANAGGATRRATSTPSANVARAGISTTTATVQTATGKTETVFEDNNLYTGRIGVRSSASSRVPTIRVASATMTTSTSSSASTPNVAETTSEMDKLAELTDYCKAQYTACMDNFCNVLDDNQGRCSCSANLKNYEKTEQALKAATEELQEVAQKIQYIGLTSDEITTLFSETEAEEAMRNQTDNSQIKANLDKVRDMIIDVRSGANTTSDTGMTFDLSNLLDFTISSTGFDLSALFGTSTNTTSINNQRGETLYKTAVSRCKANVLNSCTAQGVDASVITNSYDLEIDKQCIAYERDLSDSNDQMTATVRNAKAVLQKARLMVAQQRNQYDLRGCVAALDACMQDDYVCGADYENCLDPSGKYIVNGQIIVGSLPGRALSGENSAATTPGMFKTSLYETWCTDSSCSKFAWDYDGQTSGDLADYINDTLYTGNVYPKQTSTNMSKFLQYKIGYHDSSKNTTEGGRNFGMCMSVLNKCQDYTYDKKRNYKPNNNVISEYLYRTMIQIRAAQDAILSEYAESCIQDVASCLSTNGYDVATNKNIPVNACKAVIATCMSVNGNVTKEPSPREMLDWAAQVYDGTIAASSDANTGSSNSGSGNNSGSGSGNNSGGGSSSTTTTYTITYNCNGGSGSVSSQTCTAGTTVNLANVSGCGSRNGYTRSGWNDGATTYQCNSNKTFTAQWTQQTTPPATTYTITYDCNGGSGSVSSQTCTAGSTVTLPSASGCGTKSGNTLSGWNGGATSYQCNSNATFTAQWAQNTTPSIAHSEDGPACTGAAANGTYGGCVTAGRKCETVYYVYNGTCRSPCADVDTNFGAASIDSSCTSVSPYGTDNGCVAKYCRCSADVYSSYVGSAGGYQRPACLFQTHTVSYECDNGSYSIEADTCKYGTTVALKNVSVCGQKNGSNATGWDNGATTYLCEGNKTFTAQWGQPTNSYDYTITLNKNGGTGGTSTLYVKSGDGTYLDSNLNELYNHSCSSGDFVVPTKNNSTFVGYYSQQSGGTEYIDNGGCLTMEGYEVIDRHQNETWYARWESRVSETSTPTTYTITYNCNGGSGSIASQTCTAGSTVTLTGASGCGTKSGYTLSGWNNNAATYACNSDTTFTAQWTENAPTTYTFTFNCGGGNGSVESLTCTAGSTVTLPSTSGCGSNPTNSCWAPRTSWSYKGASQTSYRCNSNITFYAIWEATDSCYNHTVTLDKNGGTGGISNLYARNDNQGTYGMYLDPQMEEKILKECGNGPIDMPDKSGMYFVGYYSQQSGTSDKYVDADGCITEEGMDVVYHREQDETWYAHWATPVTSNVTFDCGEGTPTSTFENVRTGNKVTLLSADACTPPENSNWTMEFTRWLCDNTKYRAGETLIPSGDTTCTAGFAPGVSGEHEGTGEE